MKILGLITARGGSKGIPGKNIKLLAGKPLIAYTIEAANESGVIDRLILSTDDEAIAEVGKKYGAEAPFSRPAKLAKDNTPTLPVLAHAVEWLRKREYYVPDYVMVLQPTAPFRTARHIREAVKLMKERQPDSVVSFVPVPEDFNPHWIARIDDRGLARLWSGEPLWKRIARRQDLPERDRTYSFNGAIYLFKTSLLFSKNPNFYGDVTVPYVMKPEESVNINVPADWEAAKRAIGKIKGKS